MAVEIRDQQNDIWVGDFARETLTRVTSDPGIDQAPVWASGGSRIVFTSQASGPGTLFWQAADGTGTAELLSHTANPKRASAVSADGTRLLFWEGSAATATDILMLMLDGDHQVQPLLQTPFAEMNPELSPDGRWLAYQTNDSGQLQITVQPFPDMSKGRWQVSTGGGTQPLWARNGRELFYLAPGNALMSVPVERGATWTAGPPTKLMDVRYFGDVGTNIARTYDASLDGRRFLMIKEHTPDQTPEPASIIVVQNWAEELKRLVPTTR